MSFARWKSPLRQLIADRAANALIEFLRLRFSLYGAVDYLKHPERRDPWGGPFNGQRARMALFESIVAGCSPVAIVETGTYLGSTTEYLATTGLPIYSVENDRRTYGFAKVRLWRQRNIHLKRSDSRVALRLWLDGPLHSGKGGSVLFYLDAHWGADLPLYEELVLIFDRCSDAIVIIDDFSVPFDQGYGYDDYGDGNALIPAYIRPAVCSLQLRTFYPSTPSAEETGACRGCVVLVKEASLAHIMESLPLLRYFASKLGQH
jgi:predicted O-methyltransferase YrrM